VKRLPSIVAGLRIHGADTGTAVLALK
jgi:hypothetical protein